MNQKIDCSRIKVGVVFSEPVYFDDGQNMFLAKNRPAKAYHVAALKRWKIPFLLTVGHEINNSNQTNQIANQSSQENQILQSKTDSSNSFNDSDVAELEDFEEL